MAAAFPLWFKLAFTATTLVVLGVYWFRYGPGNYLWLSNIALAGTTLALWLEHALLASTMAVLVLVPEMIWILVLGIRVVTGWRLGGMLAYMFDRQRPLWLRLLSLYHLPLPLVLVWTVWTLGYDPRALLLALILSWIILPLTWLLTPAEGNINWVHALFTEGPPQGAIHPLLYLLLIMLGMVLLFHVPAHLVLAALPVRPV